MGALGGGLGAIWAPRVAQDGPRVEKHGSLTAPWDPKIEKFRHFFEFFCIVLRCFFEAVFGRPRDLIFRGFVDDF